MLRILKTAKTPVPLPNCLDERVAMSWIKRQTLLPVTFATTLLALAIAATAVGHSLTDSQARATPMKIVSCKSNNPCLSENNTGSGPAICAYTDVNTCAGFVGALVGRSQGLDGVLGASIYSNGVDGYSSTRAGGFFESDLQNGGSGSGALMAQGDQSTTYLFNAFNTKTGGSAYIRYDGVAAFSGDVYAPGFIINSRSRNGTYVESFSAQSTRATIEDTGTARLSNGEAAVRFDSSFASTIDAQRGYQVFLTPGGDTRGLYVAQKYEAGFIVRENEHGRSSVYFDYRVVARPLGSTDAELPRLSIRMPGVTAIPRE